MHLSSAILKLSLFIKIWNSSIDIFITSHIATKLSYLTQWGTILSHFCPIFHVLELRFEWYHIWKNFSCLVILSNIFPSYFHAWVTTRSKYFEEKVIFEEDERDSLHFSSWKIWAMIGTDIGWLYLIIYELSRTLRHSFPLIALNFKKLPFLAQIEGISLKNNSLQHIGFWEMLDSVSNHLNMH